MAKISKHAGPSYVMELATGPVDVTEFVIGEQGPELAPAGVEEELAAEAPPVSGYDAMLRTDLQDLCRERGLPTSGNKDEIVARLVAADEVAELEE